MSGSPTKPPAYAGTDFIIARDGKLPPSISSLMSFRDLDVETEKGLLMVWSGRAMQLTVKSGKAGIRESLPRTAVTAAPKRSYRINPT